MKAVPVIMQLVPFASIALITVLIFFTLTLLTWRSVKGHQSMLHKARHVSDASPTVTTASRLDVIVESNRRITHDLNEEIASFGTKRSEDERLQRQADDLDRIAENRKRMEGRP